MKNSIMLNDSKAAHFAYVGDSILGNEVNLGAGTRLANLTFLRGNIHIKVDKKIMNTHRKKLGAILGDRVETGCNSVCSPGTLLSPRSIVYPCINVPPGFYPAKSIVKDKK
jgi:bifunctional N-acetylglucosamine-1-phosphate-uridyltransferase/glucosamine-1-phosphate-acetyltransferase GlmU-like protein